MILKIFKILFIFLLNALLAGCEFEDMDDMASPGYSAPSEMDNVDHNTNGFVIDQTWWSFKPRVPGDTMSHEKDTLKEFPSQKTFTESSLSYIFGLQSLASEVVSSLRDIVSDNQNDQWMNFTSPYLGAFVSIFDSRVKQWQLETDAMFEDIKWPYHLVISDLPDGTMTGKNQKALEIFYDSHFMSGVMFFSPSHFNPVRYPERVMGHDMIVKLYFSSADGDLENTLYVSDFGSCNSPECFGNLYLYTRLQGNSISFASIVDMPYLWFDKIENPGYSVVMMGGIDCSTTNTAVLSCICPNTESNVIGDVFVNRENVAQRMPEYNAQWIAMKNIPDSVAVIEEYLSPSFLQNGEFVGAGRGVAERAVFAKPLAKANEIIISQFAISPLKVSILDIEW